MPFITLTTDFGSRDWFVGAMKGVIAQLAPKANVIDLSHEISAGDIRGGAFAVAAGYRFFPEGTVHLAVVDPGVGSTRKAIAVQTADYFFVGPDNGVLSWALRKEKVRAIRALEDETYFLATVSQTFHGRDIFAPIAAHLTRGVPIRKLGSALKDFEHLPWPESQHCEDGIAGEVVYIDRFGNAITNLEAGPRFVSAICEVYGKRPWRCPLKEFYQAVPKGKPGAIPGSSGFLEIAVNGGSAEKQLGLKRGARVVLRPF
jgi:S-adenosylmethionine hydrolase